MTTVTVLEVMCFAHVTEICKSGVLSSPKAKQKCLLFLHLQSYYPEANNKF